MKDGWRSFLILGVESFEASSGCVKEEKETVARVEE